jgi:anti-sigma factor RsiW
MTPDEARDAFSAAYDAQLDAEAQQAFDAALARDASLAAEYAEFRSLLQAAGFDVVSGPVPDLLPGVQRRLRARSRGRFYADRFAERAGLGFRNPISVLVAMLLIGGLAWAALRLVTAIQM